MYMYMCIDGHVHVHVHVQYMYLHVRRQRDVIMLSDEQYVIRTPDAGGTQLYDFVWFVPTLRVVELAVKGCGNAHVALCRQPQNYSADCYEVILGSYGNTVVEIRDKPGVSDVIAAATHTPLTLFSRRHKTPTSSARFHAIYTLFCTCTGHDS